MTLVEGPGPGGLGYKGAGSRHNMGLSTQRKRKEADPIQIDSHRVRLKAGLSGTPGRGVSANPCRSVLPTERSCPSQQTPLMGRRAPASLGSLIA